MMLKCTLCALLLVAFRALTIDCRSYNTGLIFYNLENHNTYLPPTISVSRGRGLAKYKYSPRGSIWSTFGKPCDCKGPFCGCCVGIKVKQYNFDQKMCANVSYALPRDEVQLDVYLNDTATAKYGISARNPSPLCVPIMMGIPMSMCIQMSNIAVQGDNLNMCMDFLVRLASTELFEMHFQCMKVGLQGASWVGADGQPVIPANEGKLKDKISLNSDEYYDESEVDNEIISNEEEAENENNSTKENNDLNKAEEEMDNNDITEKIMDIVKEKEQQGEKDSEENKVESMLRPFQDTQNVEEIVTNIMDSINQGNKLQEIDDVRESSSQVEADQSTVEDIKEIQVDNNSENPDSEKQADDSIENPAIEIETKEESKKEIIEDSTELQGNVEESKITSSKHEINDEDKQDKDNLVNNSDDMLEHHKSKDEFNVAELFEDSVEKEMQVESDQVKNQETVGSQQESDKIMTPIIVLEEATTEKLLEQQMPAAVEQSQKFESIDDDELNKFFKIKQTTSEATTQSITTGNNALLTTQQTMLTTGTTAVMTTTTKTSTTTTNKPAILNANFVATVTLPNNTEIVDNDRTEGEEEDDDANSDDDDDYDGDSDDDDENSHENDSDYDDEESNETGTETEDKPIQFDNAAITVKSSALNENNTNANDPKESPALQEAANNSNSNESQSAEDSTEHTNDEFETEEGEEYDDEYEDYETTAAAEVTATDKKSNEHNNTCCKPIITVVPTIKPLQHNNNKAERTQLETATSHNLQFVSTSNDTISQTGDKNMLNTKSTHNIPQATVDSMAAAITTASSNAVPLPLARKFHITSLHQHHQRQPQHLKRQNHQLHQHYV